MTFELGLTQTDKVFAANLLAANLVAIANARGAEQEKLLRGTGIFSSDLTSQRRVSASQLLRLVGNAQTYVQGYDCAFQAGRNLVSSHSNALLHVLTYSSNFESALRAITVAQTVISPFISATVHRDGEWGYLLLQDALGAGKRFGFMLEMYCSALVALSKQCVGRRIPFHFSFPFPRPRHIQEYEENLGYRLKFDQPVCMIKFPISDLHTPFILANRVAKKYALTGVMSARPCRYTFLDQVRRILRKESAITLPVLAEKFALSPATLKRKLAEHGVSFKQLYDETRRQQVVCCLQLQQLNNEQSANQLAISDMTNFRRAVKRWTGFTPSELRQAWF